jgi:DHA2 family multidrug resistance protein
MAERAPLPPLPREERALATIAVPLASFMHGLDLSVTNVSIPAIAGDLGGSLTQGTWAITSYAVSSAIVIPLTGWLTARIGQVRLFVWSVLMFTLASALCGLSSSMEMLVVARILQGITSGPMTPLAMALLMSSYPPQKVIVAITTAMMTAMVSPIIGPILGGWLTDNFSWPWIFFINIPIGLFSAWTSWRIYRGRETPRVRQPVDYVGLVLLVAWVACVQIVLDLGREEGWFDSPVVTAMAAIGAITFIVFVIWEWYDPHPVVDLHLFKVPNFMMGALVVGVGTIPYFGNVVLMALWLQQTLGYTAFLAGWVVMFGGMAMLFIQPFVSKLVTRIGVRPVTCIGLALMLAGTILRAGFTTSVTEIDLIVPQLLIGFGTGAFFMPLMLLSVGGLPQWQVPSANGLYTFVRTLSTGIGASLSTTMWDERTAHHRATLVSHISPSDQPAMDALTTLNGAVGQDGGLAVMERLVATQAQTLGVNDFSVFSVLLFVVCFLVILMMPAVKTQPHG